MLLKQPRANSHTRLRQRVARVNVELAVQVNETVESRWAVAGMSAKGSGDNTMEFVAVDRLSQRIQIARDGLHHARVSRKNLTDQAGPSSDSCSLWLNKRLKCTGRIPKAQHIWISFWIIKLLVDPKFRSHRHDDAESGARDDG